MGGAYALTCVDSEETPCKMEVVVTPSRRDETCDVTDAAAGETGSRADTPAIARVDAEFLARAREAGEWLVVVDVPLLLETMGDATALRDEGVDLVSLLPGLVQGAFERL